MTNVMGPQQQIYLAGAPLDSFMFWVPQSGRLGLGVSILSYNDRVWLGVITDRGLVPDPERIIAAFETEFAALQEAAKEARKAARPEREVQQLDKTLGTLDALLQETVQRGEEAPSSAPERCQATTKAGRPCKNAPLTGSSYCYVHQEV